jgi:hypothetical protein
MRPTRALIALSLAAGLAACASKATTAAEGTPASASRAPRRDPSIMDTTEFRTGEFSTIYDAISRKHSDWLMVRGGATNATPGGQTQSVGVWVDGSMRNRGIQYLKDTRPIEVKLIKHLSPTESLHTYSWPWGGIVVTLR